MNFDGAAAGEPHRPGILVAHAEFQIARAARPASAFCASPITAPSTQPPETEPLKAPSSRIAIWLPSGRGADPQVRVTVASATLRAPSSQPVAAVNGSELLLSMAALIAWPRTARCAMTFTRCARYSADANRSEVKFSGIDVNAGERTGGEVVTLSAVSSSRCAIDTGGRTRHRHANGIVRNPRRRLRAWHSAKPDWEIWRSRRGGAGETRLQSRFPRVPARSRTFR